MMNDREMLKNIEYLRERADISYEEALDLLTRCDGNLMRALVELERQGRLHVSSQSAKASAAPKKEVKKSSSALSRALKWRIVAEDPHFKNSGRSDTIANFSCVYCVLALIIAPHLTLLSLLASFVLGYHLRLIKRAPAPIPQDMNTFVDQTVSNIKNAASSFAQSARDAAQTQESQEEENEITIE